MSNQNKKHKNIRDSYKLYKSIVENPVDIKTYVNLCNKYNKFLIRKVIEGEEVTLPSRLGTLKVVGKKQKIKYDEEGNVIGLAPNWVKTKELWEKNEDARKRRQKVYHTNEHSSGIRYRFFWSKARVLVTNKTLYSLLLTRTNKRTLGKNINEGFQYIIK